MRTLARGIGWTFLSIVVVLIGLAWFTAHASNPVLWPPAAGSQPVEIHVVSHGYHSGIVVQRTAATKVASRQNNDAVLAVTQRFATYPWIEIGWGDEGFYRSVPDVASLTVKQALRALFRPGNTSVVHVVGLREHPRAIFYASDMARVDLSTEGFARMLGRLDTSFARASDGAAIDDAGAGLYGPSRFFRGVETFNIFNVCNHWVARLLSAAGLPTAPVLATLPQGLLLDLKWRAGIEPLPLPAVEGRPK